MEGYKRKSQYAFFGTIASAIEIMGIASCVLLLTRYCEGYDWVFTAVGFGLYTIRSSIKEKAIKKEVLRELEKKGGLLDKLR